MVFHRKVAAPRSPKVKRVVFYKYRQNPWKYRQKQQERSPTPRSGCFCNNKVIKRDLYYSIYHTWPAKVRHKLHGHVPGFQDFILVVNSERLAELLRGRSRTAATSKMERFVIIVTAINYYHKALLLGWCSSPRSASVSIEYLKSSERFFGWLLWLGFSVIFLTA